MDQKVTAFGIGKFILDNYEPGRPLSVEESKDLIPLLMVKPHLDTNEALRSSLDEIGPARIVADHILMGKHARRVLPTAVLFALAISGGRPGTMVLLAAVLHYLIDRDLDAHLNARDLCSVFPMGVPDEDTLSKAWSMQKDPATGANILDHPEAWN